MTTHRALLIALTTAAVSLAGFGSAVVAQTNEEIPAEVTGVGVDQKPGAQLPLDVKLTDSQGRSLRLQQIFGGERPVLVTLNYSDCPMLCSVQLNQLVATLDQLDLQIGRDFDLFTLSIDPKETTEKISQTKAKYIDLLPNQSGARSNWVFATSNQEGISKITDALGFRYKYDKLTKEYYHPAMLAFVSPNGVVSSYSMDVAFPANQMRLAIIDASEGKVGSVVDQFLMLCFRYDSERNRYVASAWKIMRLGGMVTIGVILALVGPFWFGSRRQAQPVVEANESADVEQVAHNS